MKKLLFLTPPPPSSFAYEPSLTQIGRYISWRIDNHDTQTPVIFYTFVAHLEKMVPESLKVAAAVLLPNFGAILGQKLTSNTYRRDVWYKTLQKPFFCPPTWVFAPAWITLYSGMGYASYLVWRDGGGFKGKAAVPLVWYGAQLGMNWAWSHIFFGAKMIGLAEIELVALLGVASATTIAFKSVSTTAYRLMLPYVAWLAFASLSIFEVWRLNRKGKQQSIMRDRKTG